MFVARRKQVTSDVFECDLKTLPGRTIRVLYGVASEADACALDNNFHTAARIAQKAQIQTRARALELCWHSYIWER